MILYKQIGKPIAPPEEAEKVISQVTILCSAKPNDASKGGDTFQQLGRCGAPQGVNEIVSESCHTGRVIAGGVF